MSGKTGSCQEPGSFSVDKIIEKLEAARATGQEVLIGRVAIVH